MSDLDKFEEAYEEFGKLTEGVDPKVLERHMSGHTSDDVAGLPLAGGLTTLQSLANVPKTWPLARLTIPLSGFSKHLERLLEGYCLEVFATNADPDEQLGSIKAFAKDLVLVLAFHLAERIATLLRQVLDHPTKVLYDPENEVLFLPQFWLFPIYRELLNTASRNRPSKDSEVRRAASGLVKVLCTVNDSMSGGKGPKRGQPLKQGGALARFNEWFGFFLQCRIAQDSCGHVPANSKSKKKPTTTPVSNKQQNQNKPQPKQPHTHKPGSSCGKRDVKRVVRTT